MRVNWLSLGREAETSKRRSGAPAEVNCAFGKIVLSPTAMKKVGKVALLQYSMVVCAPATLVLRICGATHAAPVAATPALSMLRRLVVEGCCGASIFGLP